MKKGKKKMKMKNRSNIKSLLQHTIKLMLLSLSLLLISCDNFQHKTQNTKDVSKNETENEKKAPISEMFEIVSVETGWYQEQRPQIKIKFKNKSGKPINESIRVKYQFIENNEIFDENSDFLHLCSDVDWEYGLIKTATYKSSYGYGYGGVRHKVQAKVYFEDNSLIWKGDIEQKIIY